MEHSESISNLAKSLAVAQGQMGGAVKGKANPFFKSVYADLSSVVQAIREPLSANGLSFIQATEPSDKDEIRVITMLMHESGEWIKSTIAIPVNKADAQGYGSALTYAKRYGLQGLLGVPSEDDDGNAAAKAKPIPESSKSIGQSDWDSLPVDEQTFLQDIANEVIAMIEKNEVYAAVKHIDHAKLDPHEKSAIWSRFDSKQRSAMKKAAQPTNLAGEP